VITITKDTIDVAAVLQSVEDDAAGCSVLFLGTVRNHSDEGLVSELYFESYIEMAQEALRRIEDYAVKRWGLTKFSVVHRVGNLKVGEVIVAIAVSAAHRTEAFEAARYTIDTVKKSVPIWKKEISGSGFRWVDGVMLEDNADGNV
jgi:molybdopterin synthase catalytic subunit